MQEEESPIQELGYEAMINSESFKELKEGIHSDMIVVLPNIRS